MKTLFQAVIAATLEDNFDDIWQHLSDTVGSSSGDVSGVFFSGDEPDQWARMDRQTRARLLAEWVRTELIFLAADLRAEACAHHCRAFEQAGFTVWQTGGGCTAWGKQLPGGGEVLIGDRDGGTHHLNEDDEYGITYMRPGKDADWVNIDGTHQHLIALAATLTEESK